MVTWNALAQLEAQGETGVLITVVGCKGSTPRKAGAKMLWRPSGLTQGTVGGGAVEHAALAQCADVLSAGEPRLLEITLGQELGMCCGGLMRLYLEPVLPKVPFVLLGGGHVAQACAALLPGLGFSVHVADGREGFATAERLPGVQQLVDGLEPADLDGLPFGSRAFVLIATHDHQLDQRLLEACLTRPARWLGMIGSQRKALKTRERCLHKGIPQMALARLHCPVGLDLGAQTPHEIALSIAAEAVTLLRRGAVPDGGVRSLSMALQGDQPSQDMAKEPPAPVPLHAGKRG